MHACKHTHAYIHVHKHTYIHTYIHTYMSRAITQTVCLLFLTAEDRVQSQGITRGICGGQSGIGAGFLTVLWFSLPIIISLIFGMNQSSPSSSGAGAIAKILSPIPLTNQLHGV